MAAIDFDKLMNSVKQTFKDEGSERKDYNDKRFIKVTKDESGSGSLVVRFIPDAKSGLGTVKIFKHFGKFEDPKTGDKRWYVANCPTSIEKKCPYCEAYLEAWKNKDEKEIAKLKNGKRNESYISNVLVIKDPSDPSNNGKVMLFDYGYKISKMIEEMLNGDPDSETAPVNIYHPMQGANLIVKHSKQGQQFVLDGTKFLTPSSIVEDMEDFEKIMERTYDLTEFLQPEKYDSYEDLSNKFFKFVHGFEPGKTGGTGTSGTPEKKEPKVPKTSESTETPWDEEDTPAQSAQKPEKVTTSSSKPKSAVDDDSFFDDL